MKQGYISKAAPAQIPPESLALIAKYTRREMLPEELYTFSMILCDNEIDRDHERFTIAALEKLAELFPGKTGIFDHDPKGEKQTARIFRCELVSDSARTTGAGEAYTALKAEAYMVRSERTADLILEIDAGIKKEVSVGCSVASARCSICGAERQKAPCQHRPGRSYTVDGTALRCHTILDKPDDAYEWSFVAVPSQPAAGITKGARKAEQGLPAEVAQRIAELEKAAADADFYREKQQAEIIRLALTADGDTDPALLRKSLRALSPAELEQVQEQYRARVQRRFPPAVQTAPAGASGGSTAEEQFKI